MGIIASCCAFTTCCSCCVGLSCSCCGAIIKLTSSIATRMTYTAFFIIISFLAYLLSIFAYDIYQYFPDLLSIVGEECTNQHNCAVFTIYRITFGLFLYHLLLAILLIGVKNSKDFRAQINNGWWVPKIFLLIVFIIGDFFIPGEFFTIYAWVSVFGAGFFILAQLVLLIDLAYSWSESWVEKWGYSGVEGEENRSYYYALLAFSIFFLAISTILTILMYILFCENMSCWYNPLLITINVIICLLLVVLTIHPRVREFNHRAGLLQASIFTVYCTYYVLSAILSEPNECSNLSISFLTPENPGDDSIIDWLTLLFGAIFTVASVVYASLSVGTSSVTSSKNDLVVEDESTAIHHNDSDHDDDDDDDDEKVQSSYNYTLFHLAFAVGAMYVGMLLSNWSVISSDLGGDLVLTGATNSGWVAVCVKLLSVFVAFGLYGWVLFAPAILPNREWD